MKPVALTMCKTYVLRLFMLRRRLVNWSIRPRIDYIGHFSKFIRPEAKRVSMVCSRSFLLSISFLNKDGSMVTVVMNHTDNPISDKMHIDNKAVKETILPHAMQTLVY